MQQQIYLRTMTLYLTLIGKSASGKDVFVDYLRSEYHMPSIRFSTILTQIGREKGLLGQKEIATKAKMQELGTRLRRDYGAQIYTERILQQIQGKTHTINGARDPEEINCLRKSLGENLILIGIIADAEKRYQRLLKNGKVHSYEEFLAVEAHPAEEKIDAILEQCDAQIENNGSVTDFHQKIDAIMTTLKNRRM